MTLVRLRSLLMVLAVVTLLVVAAVPHALAAAPSRQTIPFDPVELSGVCGFDVLIEPLSNKEKQTIFFDQAGNQRFRVVTGTLKVRAINLDTDEYVDLNISGPIRLVPQADGSLKIINLGATLYSFEPNVAPDLPRLALIHGRVEATFAANGAFTLQNVRGHVDDVCAMLNNS